MKIRIPFERKGLPDDKENTAGNLQQWQNFCLSGPMLAHVGSGGARPLLGRRDEANKATGRWDLDKF